MSAFRRHTVRWLRVAPAALSLVAALLVAAAWVANRWHSLDFGVEDLRGGGSILREAGVRSVSGRVRLIALSRRSVPDPAEPSAPGGEEPVDGTFLYYGYHPVPRPPARAYAGEVNRFGFGMKLDRTPRRDDLEVVVPAWAAVSVLLILPVRATLRSARARGRWRRGQCVGCGYDLRATVGRCPECGREANGPAPAPVVPAAPGP